MFDKKASLYMRRVKEGEGATLLLSVPYRVNSGRVCEKLLV
jgi:hypothetical protein